MASPIAPLPAPIHKLDFAHLAELVGCPLDDLSASPMPGGASTRRYFRVELPAKWRPRSSAVAMFVPDGGKPEEIQKHTEGRSWPFLEVRAQLAEFGVDVPALFAERTERGWLLIEDLGDDTLANYLLRNPGEKAALYTLAVKDLARAQKQLVALPESSIVRTRAFDEDLLLWEIHHFREYGLEARGIALAADDRAAFDGIAQRLARRIASWPRGFTHRDYQSRNLMVRDEKHLSWIDFQDALMGPRIYDLVSLLNDSYQTFDRAFVEARLAEYAEASGISDLATLTREFDLVTVQRKLKDAGRFVFVDQVKKNPSFLPFVKPTIAKVHASLERLKDDADMAALSKLLGKVLV